MTTLLSPQDLYRARPGQVDFVDVPEMAFLVVPGQGAPDGAEFAEAIRALYAASYAAHFVVKKATGSAPRVMPLEGLWWVDGGDGSAWFHVDRDDWRWQAMIMQPAPIDAETIDEALAKIGSKELAALDRLRYEHWTEGPCAQLMHVGPYSAEAPSLAVLHEAIAAAGLRAHGRHHEIYLGDPRRAAPAKLRTILRQPVQAP